MKNADIEEIIAFNTFLLDVTLNNSKEHGYGSRLRQLLVELDVSPLEFSKELGYKKPDQIYQYINNEKEFSASFLNSIKKNYPIVNTGWLIDGKGEIFTKELPKISCESGFSIFPADLNHTYLRALSLALANKLHINLSWDNVQIRVRKSLKKGLEIEISSYIEEVLTYSVDRVRSFILTPAWEIGIFLDHSNAPIDDDENCENFSEPNENYKIAFNNVLYDLIEKLKGDKALEQSGNSFLKSDGWVNLFRNFSRKTDISFKDICNYFQ